MKTWREWEVPREAEQMDRRGKNNSHRLEAIPIARQKEIDSSIAAKAEFENLYDKPLRRQEESPSGRSLHRREPKSRIVCWEWMRMMS